MDIAALSEATAALVAAGAAQGVGDRAANSTITVMLQRIRQVFGGDRRAQESLDQAASTGAEEAARELAAALRWYAERDRDFAAELERWAASPQPHVTQTVHAGRDAYVAGGDQTVTHHHKRADD